MTRREMMAATPAAFAAAQAPVLDAPVVRRHDEALDSLLKRQVTDPSSPQVGGMSDGDGLYYPGSAGGIFDAGVAALVCRESRHYGSAEVQKRVLLAVEHLRRRQHSDGTLDLVITNFHSTPDLGFVVNAVANGALLAKNAGLKEVSASIEPFLKKAGDALAVGGVHTPNHRWVVCAALAQIHELMPDSRYPKRVDQWLAEGIDIDSDGQFDERSTSIYNAVTGNALTVVASKLKKPELLDDVRKNLDSMMYLLHPGFEVVTDISRRQDLNARGDMRRYWFALRYLAALDGNGRYRTMLDAIEPAAISLPLLLAWPELSRTLPEPAILPLDYERHLPECRFVRVRRNDRSATLALDERSRFLSLRNGGCVVEAVRFASAFFGKAQFVAQQARKTQQGWLLTQELDGPYYQPLQPPRRVPAGEWGAMRPDRSRSEVMRLRQSVMFRETPKGFAADLTSEGTDDVPLTVEICLRPGGVLEGATEDPREKDVYLLREGSAVYRQEGRSIRFGPGAGAHRYIHVRGAEPPVPGTSVYLCGYTPFRHTLEFECL